MAVGDGPPGGMMTLAIAAASGGLVSSLGFGLSPFAGPGVDGVR